MYCGIDKKWGCEAVIDLVRLDVPAEMPDEPLVRVWVLDQTEESVGSCDPGFQIVNVIIEAPRGPNEH